MKIQNGLPLIVLLLLAIAGCQPYDDGPKISFKSKTDRVVNNWMVENVYVKDEILDITGDITEDYETYNIEFFPGGYFEARVTDDLDSVHIQEGLWDLVENDEQLRLLFTEPAITPDRDFLTILRLKQDEMWFTRVDGDTTLLEYRMLPVGGGN